MRSLGPTQRWIVMVFDALVFSLLLIAVFAQRLDANPLILLSTVSFWLFIGLLFICQFWFSLYDLEWRHGWRSILEKQLGSLVLFFVLTVLANYLLGKYRSGVFGRGILLATLAAFGVVSVTLRYLLAKYNRDWQSGTRFLFVVGSDDEAILREKYPMPPHWPLEFLRFENLRQRLAQEFVEPRQVWIFSSVERGERRGLGLDTEVFNDLIHQRFAGERVVDLVTFIEGNFGKIPLEFVDSSWLLEARGFRLLDSQPYRWLKRGVDLLCASLLLVAIFPLMLLVAVLVKVDSRGPILYKQLRAGRWGKVFSIWKFRSMTVDAEKEGAQWAQKQDQRITRVGGWLRKTRLDETPQLLNILLGQMSFIGPRPERPEFVKSLTEVIPYFQLRTAIEPGLTGWAQVLYPYGASVEDARQKLQFDLYYMKNYSLTLDLVILLKTVQVVLRAKGR